MEFVDLISDDEVEVVAQCAVCLHSVSERNQRFYFECLHMFCVACSQYMARNGQHRCPLCRAEMAQSIITRETGVAPVAPVAPLTLVQPPVYLEDNPALDDEDSYFESDDSSVEWSDLSGSEDSDVE